MSFYLKVSYFNKTKKYMVRNVKLINFNQILKELSVPNDSKYLYSFDQKEINKSKLLSNQNEDLLLTEQQLLQKLAEINGSEKMLTIKVKIINTMQCFKSQLTRRISHIKEATEKHQHSEKEKDQGDQDFEIPIAILKNRSRSVDMCCETEIFDTQTKNFQITQEFMVNSHYQNAVFKPTEIKSSEMLEVERLLALNDKKMKALESRSRTTNIQKLMKFLHDRS